MNPPFVKLTSAQVDDIRARVKALDFDLIEKVRKAKDDNGSFDVIISTEDTDRSGEIVKQNGWELANYKNNPIVLWGHDYYSLPVGVCTETYLTEKNGVPALGARGVFLSADINPFAQQIRKLYEFGIKQGAGVGCTTSVGFIPKEFDENARNTITKAELLEFSFVPIPANQGVGPAQGRAFTVAEARELGLDMDVMRTKGIEFTRTLGAVPENTSDKKAPDNTAWSAPTLKDFTEKEWNDLTGAEKRAIESHFAYIKADGSGEQRFEDLKLPYRRASDGAIVLAGLKVAMRELVNAVDVNGDRHEVYSHLASFYKLFGKAAPEFATLKEAQPGDSCEMDDGSPGVLTSDPKDPDGALVCLPQEQDKSADNGSASQQALLKSLDEEHDRHGTEVSKCFDAFQKAVAEDQGDPADPKDSKAVAKRLTDDQRNMRDNLKDLRDSLADEHDMHRAKAIATFRSFEPEATKAFDKGEHLKALRGAHEEYETKNNKSLDSFEEKCMKSVQGGPAATDEHTDWVTGKMETNQNVHKKAVTKIAKAMCKAAFGEQDETDEKTVAILTEFLTPHVNSLILPAVIANLGAALSAAAKEKLGEAHDHLKAAKAVLESLQPGFADGSGEGSRSDDSKSVDDGSRETRSKPRPTSHSDEALKAHIQARETVAGIEAVAREALGKLNAEIRGHSKK